MERELIYRYVICAHARLVALLTLLFNIEIEIFHSLWKAHYTHVHTYRKTPLLNKLRDPRFITHPLSLSLTQI